MQPKLACCRKPCPTSVALNAYHSPRRLQSCTLPPFMQRQEDVEFHHRIWRRRGGRVDKQPRRTDVPSESRAMLRHAMLVDPAKHNWYPGLESDRFSWLHSITHQVRARDARICRNGFHNMER